MALKNVTAIIQESYLTPVIESLRRNDVPGVSVMYIKGFGEYRNSFARNSLVDNVRLDIIIDESRVDIIRNIVFEHAGSGIISVTDVDSLYRIRDQKKIS